MKAKRADTDRGFSGIEFEDNYGTTCSIQMSSSADEPKIWLGVSDAKPQIMASKAEEYGVNSGDGTGWVPFPIPQDVLLTTRMHLTKEDARILISWLQKFVDTESI